MGRRGLAVPAAALALWEESSGLSWDQSGTTQTLRRGADEQFFGGGMQNGRFSHRGNTIQIARNFNYADHGDWAEAKLACAAG